MQKSNKIFVGEYRKFPTERSPLPFPGEELPWDGWHKIKPVFIARFEEAHKNASIIASVDHETCRVCGEELGNVSYSRHPWQWHYGYMHYIKEHDEVVPKEFWEFIVSLTTKQAQPIYEEIRLMKEPPKKRPIWSIDITGSSNIAKALYNVESQNLMIEFLSGKRYIYHDVPLSVIVGFTKSGSAGSYFSKHIKEIFEYSTK